MIPGMRTDVEGACPLSSLGERNHLLELSQGILPVPKKPERNAVQVQCVNQCAHITCRPPYLRCTLGGRQRFSIRASMKVDICK